MQELDIYFTYSGIISHPKKGDYSTQLIFDTIKSEYEINKSDFIVGTKNILLTHVGLHNYIMSHAQLPNMIDFKTVKVDDIIFFKDETIIQNPPRYTWKINYTIMSKEYSCVAIYPDTYVIIDKNSNEIFIIPVKNQIKVYKKA